MNETEFLALPKDQRKEVQKQLKEQGHYFGPIDGLSGEGTRNALKAQEDARAARRDAAEERDIEKRRLAIEETKAKAQAKSETADAEAKAAEAERRRQYTEQAGSPMGLAAQIGANTAAPLVGYGVGRKLGEGLNTAANLSQAKKNESLAAGAQGRIEGMTTREGARIGAERSGAMPSKYSALRVGGRMLPHTITGLGMGAKGLAMLSQENEDDPFYAQMANRAAGMGMLGTGVGIMEKGAAYAISPGESPSARDIAIIESNQINRRGPSRTARSLASGPSKAELYQEAKDLKIPGRSRMSKTELARTLANTRAEGQSVAGRITDAAKKGRISGIIAPIAAGTMAYNAATSDARAEGASPMESQARGIGAGAATGGATAGGMYAGSKLAQTLANRAPNAMRALGGGATAAAIPASIDAMTDYSQGERNTMRNWAARNLPEFMHVGQIGEAAEMAQVPEPNPQRGQPQPQQAAQPQGFPDDLRSQVQNLMQQGASPDLVAAYLNQIAAQ